MPPNSAIIPWQSAKPTVIPKEAAQPAVIVEKYAVALRPADKRALVNAFERGDYGMGAGHLWRRSMSRLRARLASLGMKFLGEMLNREDITEESSVESVLTDHDTIYLAEALGFVDSTGAMRLRQGFETVSHFDSEQASEEMSLVEAGSVARACVQYIFGSDESTTAIDFTRFRDRLLSETFANDDVGILQLLDSPLFFIRTALRVLLAAAKTEEGARLEHGLANLNSFLPGMWPKLTDDDRWSVGTTFAELSNVGNRPQAVSGVRKALLRVKGFDFVPENLRSNSFKRAAQAVLSAHHSFGNYAAEPEPTKHLASMGSSIPVPALAECLRAYLCVYLGNYYGYSWDAASVAEREMKNVSRDRWERYFSKVFSGEQEILSKLTETKPTSRWLDLIVSLGLTDLDLPPGPVSKLFEATAKRSANEVNKHALVLLTQFRGPATTQ
jgi:hypothetical protein